ncbi:MAG: isoprenyl transferase [Candidatus Cloacimonetes bacterium]|nr:isoprenyl transferase [Candidatus Cloacimonadota bacterium]
MESDYKDLIPQLDKEKLPQHIAIIMDGNGRWAQAHKMKRVNGHKAGVKVVKQMVETAREIGLKYLTVYAFSTENWGRSDYEVNYLLKLILDSLINEIDELTNNGVNIHFLGSKERLPKGYEKKVEENCRRSWENSELFLNVAMNYGGRQELVEAVKKIAASAVSGELAIADIDGNTISDNLYTAGMPDPDLIIRTSGEIRLSNYLIWQSTYAEFWFTETLWPDFTRSEFIQAIIDYQNRKRRFGKRK